MASATMDGGRTDTALVGGGSYCCGRSGIHRWEVMYETSSYPTTSSCGRTLNTESDEDCCLVLKMVAGRIN